MLDTRLKSYEMMVLLQFYFHSMDLRTYLNNRQSTSHPDIYAFWDGKNTCSNLCKDKNRYEKAFDKLVKFKFIKDWGSFQHLTYKGVNYINSL